MFSAKKLGLGSYRIDLSQLVSKYIGETEKNLDQVFEAAEDGDAILLFDEADALLGKRSRLRKENIRNLDNDMIYFSRYQLTQKSPELASDVFVRYIGGADESPSLNPQTIDGIFINHLSSQILIG